VNPGLLLLGIGADADLAPQWRLIGNVNWLSFGDTNVLEYLRNQGNISATSAPTCRWRCSTGPSCPRTSSSISPWPGCNRVRLPPAVPRRQAAVFGAGQPLLTF
jgi:hypothetical protein